MQNDEVPFSQAWRYTGYTYGTIKRLRYLGELPFPVYERVRPGLKKPKLFCHISDIEKWKNESTTKVPAGR